MENNVQEKKNIIIKWLMEFKRLPTSRFVGLTGWSYDNVKKILEEIKSGELIQIFIKRKNVGFLVFGITR